ncbi:MAG: serine O-acetyltransferase [Planctomycetota bacterium]
MDDARLGDLADRVRDGLSPHRSFSVINDEGRPDRSSVQELCAMVLATLFPGYFSDALFLGRHVDTFMRHNLLRLRCLLRRQVANAMRFGHSAAGTEAPGDLQEQVDATIDRCMDALPEVAALVSSDVEAAFENDPAAASREEILVSYPCLEAICIQRVAHRLYRCGIPLIPRMMTETAHSRTGIDIHPGAAIGPHFFIDHGTGVVVGETCEIGDHCVLYHGVTLGAFNPLARNEEGELSRGQSNKRHPTLEDHVIVYPGATILGGATTIGHHSVIGGNVWLTQSVEPESTITTKDPELVIRQRRRG